MSCQQLEREFYAYNAPLLPEQWPYKSPMARNRLMEAVPRPKPEPGECPECVGRKVVWRPKNVRTGSLKMAVCTHCNGTGKS